jgi:hypothetical protein
LIGLFDTSVSGQERLTLKTKPRELIARELFDGNPAWYRIDRKGDLVFCVDNDTRKSLKAIQKREDKGEPLGFHCDDFFIEVIENCLCNGLNIVDPSHIGALTDSLIFADGHILDYYDNPDPELIKQTDFYWYPKYMLQSPIEALARYSKVVFTKAH